MAGKTRVCMSNATRVQRSRGGLHLLKQSNIPILVLNVITLEDDTVLPFASGIPFREFIAFDDHESKEISEVDLFLSLVSCRTYVLPLTQRRPFPNLFQFKIIPLFPISFHGKWMLKEISTANRLSGGQMKGHHISLCILLAMTKRT